MNKRTICIGDVHGAGRELSALLLDMKVSKDDRIILLGDVFDRGMHGAMVWDLVHKYKMEVIMGNHERKMLRYLKGEIQIVPYHYHWALDDMIWNKRCCSRPELIKWLEDLPLMIQEDDNIFVHGGIDPLCPTREDLHCNIYGGDMKVPWWDKYDGDNMILYGHLSTEDHKPRIRKNSKGNINSIGLDGSAVRGGNLNAYCVETKEFFSYSSGIDWFAKLNQNKSKKSNSL